MSNKGRGVRFHINTNSRHFRSVRPGSGLRHGGVALGLASEVGRRFSLGTGVVCMHRHTGGHPGLNSVASGTGTSL